MNVEGSSTQALSPGLSRRLSRSSMCFFPDLTRFRSFFPPGTHSTRSTRSWEDRVKGPGPSGLNSFCMTLLGGDHLDLLLGRTSSTLGPFPVVIPPLTSTPPPATYPITFTELWSSTQISGVHGHPFQDCFLGPSLFSVYYFS